MWKMSLSSSDLETFVAIKVRLKALKRKYIYPGIEAGGEQNPFNTMREGGSSI